MKGFGARQRESRDIRNLTQRELAIMCDTDEAIIRGYEHRSPSKSMMLKLFDALKTSPDFFFQDELSFNPYQDRDSLFADISRLNPAQYKLLRSFVDTLKAQD